jgi:hypothetical protein
MLKCGISFRTSHEEGLNLPALGYECEEKSDRARATHVTLRKPG